MNGNNIAKIVFAAIVGLGAAWYAGYHVGFYECKSKTQDLVIECLNKKLDKEKVDKSETEEVES